MVLRFIKTNKPEITQDEMKAEPAQSNCHRKGLKLLRSSTSSPDIPSLSYNMRTLVDIFGIGPLSATDVESISNCNTETFIQFHNIALEKFSRIATGDYFCKYERSDEFHDVQT